MYPRISWKSVTLPRFSPPTEVSMSTVAFKVRIFPASSFSRLISSCCVAVCSLALLWSTSTGRVRKRQPLVLSSKARAVGRRTARDGFIDRGSADARNHQYSEPLVYRRAEGFVRRTRKRRPSGSLLRPGGFAVGSHILFVLGGAAGKAVMSQVVAHEVQEPGVL